MKKNNDLHEFIGGKEINITSVATSWEKEDFCNAFKGKLSDISEEDAYDKCKDIYDKSTGTIAKAKKPKKEIAKTSE